MFPHTQTSSVICPRVLTAVEIYLVTHVRIFFFFFNNLSDRTTPSVISSIADSPLALILKVHSLLTIEVWPFLCVVSVPVELLPG